MQSKIKLRQKFTTIRSQIKTAYRQQAALKAAQIFAQQSIFKQSESIACYLAYKDEFDAAALIETVWHAKKHCYLPVLGDKDEKLLTFVRYEYGDALQLNRFSILEPIHRKRTIPAKDLDCVITPLVAFDPQGHRLGTGGGYYDHTFAFLQGGIRKPRLIGLGYAEQQADELPSDSWDINLDAVVTEKSFINF